VINVEIFLDEKRIFRKITLNGHSNFSKKGQDIVCAAVSILFYSAYLSLINIDGVEYNFNDSGIEAYIEVIGYNEKITGHLIGVSIFLLSGLEALKEEYTEEIDINIIDFK